MLKVGKFIVYILLFTTGLFAGAFVDSLIHRKYFPQNVNHNSISGNKVKKGSEGTISIDVKPESKHDPGVMIERVDTIPTKRRWFKKKK